MSSRKLVTASHANFKIALIQESKRMASGFLGKELPGNRLRVRVPCSPL